MIVHELNHLSWLGARETAQRHAGKSGNWTSDPLISQVQSTEQLLFSYYQGTLLREFGRCELNCVNWHFIYLSTVHMKYTQAQEHLKPNFKATLSLPGTVMSSKYPTEFPKFFGKVQVWLLPHSFWTHIYYFWLKWIIVLSVWNKEWQTDDNSFILPCSLPGWKPSLIKKAIETCTNSDGKCCWCKQSVWSKNIKQCMQNCTSLMLPVGSTNQETNIKGDQAAQREKEVGYHPQESVTEMATA